MRKALGALALLAMALPAATTAQPSTTVQVPSFALPPSNYLSEESLRVIERMLSDLSPDTKGDIAAARAFYQGYNDRRLAEMRGHYKTLEVKATMGGVPVHVVTPAAGVAAGKADKVLINVHGGGFMWGSGSGALVEAVPIAAAGGYKVVAVDYRLAPEHKYPAASEDLAAVYAELLKSYRPENIGIYGCSAGGIITGQAIGWFGTHGLPRPGAIGTFCGTGAPYGGDSVFIGPLAIGGKPMVPGTKLPDFLPTAYMNGVPAADAVAYPIQSDEALAAFPPTLLLAGSRDFAASTLTAMHRRLAGQGVAAELYLFDGLPHAFFMWADLPESREAYGIIARFFDKHLGQPGAADTPPSIRFGRLFEEVQARGLFRDSKTFADAAPRHDPEAIMTEWAQARITDDAALRAFVAKHFDVPAEDLPLPEPSAARPPIREHIKALWPVLTRGATTPAPGSSLLALPQPYVVPGGRFREMYYWDSYFTMLGLKRDGRHDLVESMIADFGSLVERYGHVPNGTRTYYLSRSQPPFFYLMTTLSDDKSAAGIKRRNDWLRAEHTFWMAGADTLAPGEAQRRVVRLADGSLLNRYWDDRAAPRDESWREDVALAKATPGREPEEIYRDIRAAAESGWDFSSRWLGDGRSLATIRTTRIVPVDLNSLLYGMERVIIANCRTLADAACVSEFTARANQRREAVEKHLWNEAGYYADYDLDTGKVSALRTAAMTYPLFTQLAPAPRARLTAASLEPLVGEGGLVTTLSNTGQQWDAPNGWAPLQWIAVAGLRHYGETKRADRIAARWLATVEREYLASGRLLEKYDVVERRPGGGGEYPLQDGFGWTNGVVAEMLASKGE